MPLIFGMTGSGAGFRRLEPIDASDPLLERFVQAAWRDQLLRKPPSAPPGSYPVRLQVEYEVEGDEIRRLFVEIVQAAREPGVDTALWRALRATHKLKDLPFTFSDGVRALQTTLILRVPTSAVPLDPRPVSIAGAFSHAIRPLSGQLALARVLPPGDHELVLRVQAVDGRWAVRIVTGPGPAIESAFLGGLAGAGLLSADEPEPGDPITLILRSPG